MSYYDNQQWSASGQPSWEQQTPPARSGASSVVPREDSTAFSTQIEEVDRAIDNLVKSGKMFNPPAGGRRDSMPMVGPSRTFPEQFDPRMTAGPPRHHSVSDFGDARSFSGSNLQNFYANQRHQPSRGANEAEQVMQAKRRMAAQRERELRNYHQEQQYNRSVTAEILGGKPDRIASPGSGMSEEERRELIARQRSALYGEGPTFNAENGSFDENGTPRPTNQGSTSQTLNAAPGAIRGHSPLAFEHFNSQASQAENSNQQNATESQSATAAQAPGQQRSRANSTSSPSSNPTSFSLFESAAQQSSRTSTSSPGGSPPRQGGKAPASGVAPIGTRPSGQAANPALNKRSTTPLPSPLSYGFAANDSTTESKDARTTSAASNPNPQGQTESGLGWGSKSGVWGNKNLGVQASVWG
ncbi:hypothetical protein BGAL_0052g00020 [Botrytis galanthina]|uniref:Uncharacterized protein n=1 Tax=Botrytis galanthina TaxID=278940 RepID=A0A4S8R831_9HELO|nr:hypothetical protein BGAL_0052g00020 [Botrytis galanthina]